MRRAWTLSMGPGKRHLNQDAHSPLVVSLSRTRNVPLRFSKLSRSLSESRRVILPKYHLEEFEKETNVGHGRQKW